MRLALALVALGFASSARADDPEKLFPASTQLFVRWDGVSAHSDAYKKSVLGAVMAGPTGDSVREALKKLPKQLGGPLLAEPLLNGKPPAELKADLADLKAAEKLIDLLTDKGLIVAAEVREPRPTLKGVAGALGGLIGGRPPGAEAVIPDAQLIVMVPNVGDRAEALYGTLRLVARQTDAKLDAFEHAGRKGFRVEIPRDGPIEPNLAWWTDGGHFVLYVGTRKPREIIDEMEAAKKTGGVTANALYKRAAGLGKFESVTRGYADTGALVGLLKSLAGPFVPGLRERLDATGISNFKAVVFSSGFEGKESRALYELDAPGERKGIAKVLKKEPLGLADLPPLPSDVSRFSALRVDPAATYDAALGLIEFASFKDQFGPEDGKKPIAQQIQDRKDFLRREADKFLGITVADDLMPHLGDKLVIYQSPTEGLSVFGTVFCVSVKDAGKVWSATARIQGALENVANSPIKVKKRVVRGVETREFHSRGFGVVVPTYAIVGDWLVVGGNPQLVQGMILRHKGELPKWKPDDATAKRLAGMEPGCGLQFCDPRGTASNLCTIGPLFLAGVSNLAGRFGSGEEDFEPIDVGIIPNSHELTRHLFPNLTVTRDDGKTIRIEVNESFSLPLEVIGAEPAAFGLAITFGLLR